MYKYMVYGHSVCLKGGRKVLEEARETVDALNKSLGKDLLDIDDAGRKSYIIFPYDPSFEDVFAEDALVMILRKIGPCVLDGSYVIAQTQHHAFRRFERKNGRWISSWSKAAFDDKKPSGKTCRIRRGELDLWLSEEEIERVTQVITQTRR